MLLQSISLISIFVFLSSIQFCQVKGQCIDEPGVIQNGMTCSQLLPLGCYVATVLSKCCQSCTEAYTGVTGCEYGDKVPNCIAVLCPFYTDPSECCNTCKPATTASPPSPSTTTATAMSTTSSLQVPAAPSVDIVSQTTRNITLNVTLQAGSRANEFEIKATTGVAQKMSLPAGNVSVDYVFSALNEAGTCFTLEIVAINSAGRSAVTIMSNACYAPLPPIATIVTQTTRNVTLNLTLPEGSLGNTFEVKVTGGGTTRYAPFSVGGFRFIQYVFDAAAEAGACFDLEFVTIVTNNPIKSETTMVSNACYAPNKPEVTVVTQTTSNVTLSITLPVGSLGNNIEVKATGGGTARSVPIPVGGSKSIQHMLDIVAEAGTCFILEAVTLVTNNPITSDKTTVSNVCYAPKKPDVIVATQTTSNITLSITLPIGSLGNNFEVNVQGGVKTQSVPLALGTSRSVQHMFNDMAEAGTCFNLDIVTRVTNNPVQSDKATVSNACYGSTFEVNITNGGNVRSVSFPVGGSRSVQYVFNEAAEAGTYFSLDIVNLVANNPIKSDAKYVTNACYAPKSPEVTVVTQTTSNVTLNIKLPVASLGNIFEVKVIGGVMVRSVPLPFGAARSVQHVFNEKAEAGTCFSLEIVNLVTNNPIKSDKTNPTNACYAPKKPEVNVVTQTTRNITMNITLPAGSLGNTFEVKVAGGVTSRPVSLYIGGSRSVQHVFHEVAEAGTCFSLEIVTLVNNNPIKSDTKTVTSLCYASFPVSPGSPSSKDKMIVAVSSAGGLIFLCGAAAVLVAIIMKRRRASWVINETKHIHLHGGTETTDQYRTITETPEKHMTTSELIIQPKLVRITTRDVS